jgi:hypothetical protein
LDLVDIRKLQAAGSSTDWSKHVDIRFEPCPEIAFDDGGPSSS